MVPVSLQVGADAGVVSRFLARRLPLPLLVRSFIQTRAPGALEFIEDADLPRPAREELIGQGLGDISRGPFFLHDRSQFRSGLLVASRKQSSPPFEARRELSGQLYEWLAVSGRGDDDFRLIIAGDETFLAEHLGRYEALLAVVWRSERSPAERALARPVTTERAFRKALPGPGEALEGANNLLAFSPRDLVAMPPRRTLRVPDETPAAVQPPARPDAPAARVPAAAASASAAASAPASAGRNAKSAAASGEFHPWGELGYQVIGSGRGGPPRKFYVKKDEDRLRVSMLSSRRGIDPEYALQFFDRLQFSEDGVLAHRDMLRASGAGETASLSLEVLADGRFRCIAAGLTPVFFRAGHGKAFLIPDSAPQDRKSDRVDSVKIVEGQFHPGDALLLTPGRFSSSEQREIAEKFRALSGAERTGLLGNWLDYRSRGRALFISRV